MNMRLVVQRVSEASVEIEGKNKWTNQTRIYGISRYYE